MDDADCLDGAIPVADKENILTLYYCVARSRRTIGRRFAPIAVSGLSIESVWERAQARETVSKPA
jgi:hypothetical protein